jgi:hypothetical protein
MLISLYVVFPANTSNVVKHIRHSHQAAHDKYIGLRRQSRAAKGHGTQTLLNLVEDPHGALDAAFLHLVLLHDLPLNFGESKKFRSLLHLWNPKIKKVWTADSTYELVRDEYLTMRDSIIQLLQQQPEKSVSITTDSWTSADNVSFVAVTGMLPRLFIYIYIYIYMYIFYFLSFLVIIYIYFFYSSAFHRQ